MQLQTGYAQAALTEPWACVVASYTVEYRSGWKPGGVALIVAGPGAKDGYKLGTPYSGGQPPAKIVAVGVGGTLQAELRRRAASDGYTAGRDRRRAPRRADAGPGTPGQRRPGLR
jgi:20S proteasome alpha/beta subunit